MSYLAEAHSDWHAAHGAYATCPLDCGAMSPEQAQAEDLMNTIAYEDENGTASIRCAHCKERHGSAAAVAACAALAALSSRPEPDPEPLTYATALGYSGECEDGHCDVYNRCNKHRAQDAARGDRDGMFRSYSD